MGFKHTIHFDAVKYRQSLKEKPDPQLLEKHHLKATQAFDTARGLSRNSRARASVIAIVIKLAVVGYSTRQIKILDQQKALIEEELTARRIPIPVERERDAIGLSAVAAPLRGLTVHAVSGVVNQVTGDNGFPGSQMITDSIQQVTQLKAEVTTGIDQSLGVNILPQPSLGAFGVNQGAGGLFNQVAGATGLPGSQFISDSIQQVTQLKAEVTNGVDQSLGVNILPQPSLGAFGVNPSAGGFLNQVAGATSLPGSQFISDSIQQVSQLKAEVTNGVDQSLGLNILPQQPLGTFDVKQVTGAIVNHVATTTGPTGSKVINSIQQASNLGTQIANGIDTGSRLVDQAQQPLSTFSVDQAASAVITQVANTASNAGAQVTSNLMQQPSNLGTDVMNNIEKTSNIVAQAQSNVLAGQPLLDVPVVPLDGDVSVKNTTAAVAVQNLVATGTQAMNGLQAGLVTS